MFGEPDGGKKKCKVVLALFINGRTKMKQTVEEVLSDYRKLEERTRE